MNYSPTQNTTNTRRIQQKEQDTILLIQTLKARRFTESTYQKPNRIFTRDNSIVKINVAAAVVDYNGKVFFRGTQYSNAIKYFSNFK